MSAVDGEDDYAPEVSVPDDRPYLVTTEVSGTLLVYDCGEVVVWLIYRIPK